MMSFQRILFSVFFYVFLVRTLSGSSVFDGFMLPLDISLRQEDLASDDIKPSAQNFYDETDVASGYDDDFPKPSDSLFSIAPPSDVSTLATPDNLDSTFPLYDGTDPDLSLFEDPGCSSDVNQLINKRETGGMCTTDSPNPSTPDQSFERGGPTDPEFYGLSLAGYDLGLLGLEEENNGCRSDAFGLAQFLVCDSGKNEDRFTFYTRNGLMATGVSLKNCERITALTRLFCMYPKYVWCCQFFLTKRGEPNYAMMCHIYS